MSGDIPADVMEAARVAAVSYFTEDVELAAIIARAILAAKDAQREVDAVIADFGVKWSPAPDSATVKYINESCARIAAAIRSGQ